MSSGIANVNGTQIWYELSGSGDVVVQIGGAVSAHEGYEPVTPEIAKHFTVLNYDHRGYGLSARPKQQYTIQTWCDDLEALLAELNIEKAHIHGGSMGSFIQNELENCFWVPAQLRNVTKWESLIFAFGNTWPNLMELDLLKLQTNS